MKVAIVGGALRSKHLAPFDDEEWEIWGLGVHYKSLPRVTRIFEIHEKMGYESEDYPQRLVDTGKTIVVHKSFPIKAENVDIFPEEEVKSILDMLTSSISYMFGYAVLKGATHISLYGVDMDIDDNEYFYQRPGLYAWKGYAEKAGIIVDAPNSSLFKDKQYPSLKVDKMVPYTQDEFLKMANYHQKMMDKITGDINHLQMLFNTHSGSKQVYERLAKIARATDAGIEVESIFHSTQIRSYDGN